MQSGAAEEGRIFDEGEDEEEGEDSYGKVHEEDPAPGVAVGDPAADGGADGGGDDGGHAVDGEGQAAFGRWEGVGENGLGHRLEASSADALDDARHE